MNRLEIRKTEDGKLLARRKDGIRLTPHDLQEAKKLAGSVVSNLTRAWMIEEIRGAENLRAVKICSALLEERLWLILDRSFIPTDGLACYYPEEIPLLGDKTPEELREIHKAKLAFPGARIIQEGADTESHQHESEASWVP